MYERYKNTCLSYTEHFKAIVEDFWYRECAIAVTVSCGKQSHNDNILVLGLENWIKLQSMINVIEEFKIFQSIILGYNFKYTIYDLKS